MSHPSSAAMSRGARLRLVGALYCTQNLSLGFFTYAFLTIAQAKGVPLALIGAAAGLAIILTLKFLWAPVVDRFGSRRLGHYRGWLLLTQSGLVLGCVALSLFDPAESFTTLLVLFAVLFLLAGTQDVAADAAATRLLPPADRGLGNGVQSAGASVAQVVGGGVILVVYDAAGWTVAALTLAAFSAVALPFVLIWREERSTAQLPTPRVSLRTIAGLFASPAVRRWALLLIPLYTAGFTVAYNLVRPLLVEAGWPEARIGTVVVIAGSLFGIVAGLGAGVLISSAGRRKALIWLGVLQVVAAAGAIPMALGWTGTAEVLVVVGLSNAAFSAAAAVVFTISMDLARPESAGTDFTLFTTISGLVMVVSAGVGMMLAGTIGFIPVLLGAGVLAAVGVVAVAWLVGPVLSAGNDRGTEGPPAMVESADQARTRS